MYELYIDNKVVPFNFGMGFLRDINKVVSAPVDGVPGMKQNIGFRYTLALLLNGDVEALAEVLNLANKGCEPRLTKQAIDDYIDNEETDIEKVFEAVLGFLKTANCTKIATLEIVEEVEREKERQKALEESRMLAMK